MIPFLRQWNGLVSLVSASLLKVHLMLSLRDSTKVLLLNMSIMLHRLYSVTNYHASGFSCLEGQARQRQLFLRHYALLTSSYVRKTWHFSISGYAYIRELNLNTGHEKKEFWQFPQVKCWNRYFMSLLPSI